VETEEERRICLENVLELNPNNQAAQKGLSRLGRRPPQPADPFASSPLRQTDRPVSLASAILYPAAPIPERPQAEAPPAAPTPPIIAYQATSRYDDVWSRESEICAYCAYELEEEERCPQCEHNLVAWHYRYEKPSSNLHILWVLLAGLGQLYFVQVIADIIMGVFLPAMVLHGFLTLFLFGLAAAVYFRRFWAYTTTIVVMLILLFLTGMGVLGFADSLLPQATNPAEAMITGPFIATLTNLLQALQLGGTAMALFWAVFLAGPDFVRDKVRLQARVAPKSTDPSTLYMVGKEQARRGLWASAVLHWQRAAALHPTNTSYLRHLGQGYAHLGFYERSLDVLQTALTLSTSPAGEAQLKQSMDTIRRQQRQAPSQPL
jgi:tetratricopeptide (TPR) repeat protein